MCNVRPFYEQVKTIFYCEYKYIHTNCLPAKRNIQAQIIYCFTVITNIINDDFQTSYEEKFNKEENVTITINVQSKNNLESKSCQTSV